MNIARVIVVGIITLLIVALFVRQVITELRSGKVRPRGSRDYKTREGNPIWYWLSVATQIAVILIALYLFSQAVLKASK